MKLLFRMDEKVSETKLHRNIRAHGNFSEYVPIFLVLLLIIEFSRTIVFWLFASNLFDFFIWEDWHTQFVLRSMSPIHS